MTPPDSKVSKCIKSLQCQKCISQMEANGLLFYFNSSQESCWYSSSLFNLPCLSVTSDSLRWKRGCCLPSDSQWITLPSDRHQAWQTCCSFHEPRDYTPSERYGTVRIHLQIHNLEALRDGFERSLVISNERTHAVSSWCWVHLWSRWKISSWWFSSIL